MKNIVVLSEVLILLLFPFTLHTFILHTRIVVESPSFSWIFFNIFFLAQMWISVVFKAPFPFCFFNVTVSLFWEAMGDDGMSSMNVAKPRGCTQLLANVARSLSFVVGFFHWEFSCIFTFWGLSTVTILQSIWPPYIWKSNPLCIHFAKRNRLSSGVCFLVILHAVTCKVGQHMSTTFGALWTMESYRRNGAQNHRLLRIMGMPPCQKMLFNTFDGWQFLFFLVCYLSLQVTPSICYLPYIIQRLNMYWERCEHEYQLLCWFGKSVLMFSSTLYVEHGMDV